MQIMHRICLAKNDAPTGTVKKLPLSRHWTRDLLLPRLLSGQVEINTQGA
jgi:hypothetical protein